MSAAHVRRGGAARAKPRKSRARSRCRRRSPSGCRSTRRAPTRLAGLAFGAFMLAIGVVVLVALDIPAKAERAAGAAVGDAGFTVSGYQIVGLNHMDRALVDAVVTDELRRAAERGGHGQGAAGAGRRRRHPRAPAAVRLGQGRARLAPPARHAGHRHRRAHARRAVAEPGPAGADRRRGRGARPRAGRQDARPAAADRPRRQRARRRSSTG